MPRDEAKKLIEQIGDELTELDQAIKEHPFILALEDQDRNDESDELLQNAIAVDPTSSEGYILKGVWLMDEEPAEEAPEATEEG